MVSTDPAHSLSDSLAQVCCVRRASVRGPFDGGDVLPLFAYSLPAYSSRQDVSGGKPVAVQGTDSPLFGLEVNPEDAQAELRAFATSDGGKKSMGEFLGGLGLGAFTEQLADLRLGELLDTPPPGLDEVTSPASWLDDLFSCLLDRRPAY